MRTISNHTVLMCFSWTFLKKEGVSTGRRKERERASGAAGGEMLSWSLGIEFAHKTIIIIPCDAAFNGIFFSTTHIHGWEMKLKSLFSYWNPWTCMTLGSKIRWKCQTIIITFFTGGEELEEEWRGGKCHHHHYTKLPQTFVAHLYKL